MLEYFGFIGGALTVSAFIPQVIRTWRTRRTGDLHFGMFAILITASTLWTIYGFVIHDWAVILTNVGMVTLNGAIAVAKLRFG